ncbi:MAG TPA: nucleotidyltransferase family protein [Usitatibacteraceae bacterium]|nr:nucleotidyltransferase family protein [Usitatibacteraceae bacterium]
MITAILLAAGAARRFGAQKLLQVLPDRRLVVEAAARPLVAACGRVIAVTRDDPAVMHVLRAVGCEIVVNERAEEGMGTSIAAGVASMIDCGEQCEGWLVALGDMPFIKPATLDALLGAGEAKTHIVVPVFNALRGHPVRFPGLLSDELAALHGDRGARQLIDRHRERLIALPVDDSGVVADIDTPEDFARLLAQRRR